MKRWMIAIAAALGMLAGARPAGAQTVVYSQSFEGAAIVAPGVGESMFENPATSGRQPVLDFAGYGPSGNQFSGNWLRTAGSNGHTLTLTNLPAHTMVNVGFLLGVLDTWDIGAPDSFSVTVDGVVRFQDVFNYGGVEGNPATGATEIVTGLAGPGYGQRHSTGYNLGNFGGLNNIPHTSSTLSVTFASVLDQGGQDESWAMDNLRVSLDTTDPSAAPEPGALLLILPALGLGTMLKRRTRRG